MCIIMGVCLQGEFEDQAVYLMLCLMELILRHVEFAASHNRVVQSHVSVSLGLIGRLITSKTIISSGITIYLENKRECCLLFRILLFCEFVNF